MENFKHFLLPILLKELDRADNLSHLGWMKVSLLINIVSPFIAEVKGIFYVAHYEHFFAYNF